MKSFTLVEKLIMAALVIGMILLLVLNEKITDNAIETCVAGGNSYSYCENGLR